MKNNLKRVFLVIGLPFFLLWGATQGAIGVAVMWWEIIQEDDIQLW